MILLLYCKNEINDVILRSERGASCEAEIKPYELDAVSTVERRQL